MLLTYTEIRAKLNVSKQRYIPDFTGSYMQVNNIIVLHILLMLAKLSVKKLYRTLAA